MVLARPEFAPDPSLSRAEMESLQREIAEAAVFADRLPVDPDAVGVPSRSDDGEGTQARFGSDPALVAGVDQAFLDDRAVSAAVLIRGGEVVERVHATEPAEVAYIPGLLSFREGGAVLAALEALEATPDVVLVDGSGRIHFREAGLATHVGVALGVPTVGVAKGLLCGRPARPVEGLAAGSRVRIEADADVTAPDGTLIGHAVQTRQYDSPTRHINPLYVSPGHRVSAGTAADIVERCCRGYKLPEPIRLADAHADDLAAAGHGEGPDTGGA